MTQRQFPQAGCGIPLCKLLLLAPRSPPDGERVTGSAQPLSPQQPGEWAPVLLRATAGILASSARCCAHVPEAIDVFDAGEQAARAECRPRVPPYGRRCPPGREFPRCHVYQATGKGGRKAVSGGGRSTWTSNSQPATVGGGVWAGGGV